MKEYLTKNQFKIFAALKKNCRSIDIISDKYNISKVYFDEASFRASIYKMLPEISFQEYKENEAQQIDSLYLYTKVNYPMDPDISVILKLFQNNDNCFFLELYYKF